MKLSSIRENYGKLLTAFKDAGIKLTESQQADLDTFMVAFESKLEQTKMNAIKATRKIVESKLEKEYKAVVEDIIKHTAENAELAGKIQTKLATIDESKKLAKKVDSYLNLYLEEAMPKSKILDYARMDKLEKMFESMKDTLLVNDETIENKQNDLEKKYKSINEDLENKITDLEKKLNDANKRMINLNEKLDQSKAEKLIIEKTKDLPLFEATKIQKRLRGSSVAEVNKNFDKILESVREEMNEETKEEQKSLEEEINSIIACDTTSEEKSNKTDDETETEETNESKENNDEERDIQLTESIKIPGSYIKAWASKSCSITPISDLAGAK